VTNQYGNGAGCGVNYGALNNGPLTGTAIIESYSQFVLRESGGYAFRYVFKGQRNGWAESTPDGSKLKAGVTM